MTEDRRILQNPRLCLLSPTDTYIQYMFDNHSMVKIGKDCGYGKTCLVKVWLRQLKHVVKVGKSGMVNSACVQYFSLNQRSGQTDVTTCFRYLSRTENKEEKLYDRVLLCCIKISVMNQNTT